MKPASCKQHCQARQHPVSVSKKPMLKFLSPETNKAFQILNLYINPKPRQDRPNPHRERTSMSSGMLRNFCHGVGINTPQQHCRRCLRTKRFKGASERASATDRDAGLLKVLSSKTTTFSASSKVVFLHQ